MQILLADDEPLLRRLITGVLRSYGHAVVEVTSGIDLMDRLGDGPFDLIITDVEMGWMSGIHALASARAAGILTPAVVMSGNSVHELGDVVRRLGRATFVEKPFSLDVLLAAVEAVDPAADAAPPFIPRSPAEARA